MRPPFFVNEFRLIRLVNSDPGDFILCVEVERHCRNLAGARTKKFARVLLREFGFTGDF